MAESGPGPMPTPSETAPHMDVEAFRVHAHELVELIAGYYRTLEERPVRGEAELGAVLDAMPAAPPADGESFGGVLRDVESYVVPNVMHWQHPAFFGFFPANASWPAVLGDLLSSSLGVQGMLWSTSPACTEVEIRVLDWLALALGLPASFTSGGAHPTMDDALRELVRAPLPSDPERQANGTDDGGGVMLGTASEASLTALVAALERHRRRDDGREPVAYTSAQAHSSLVKAAGIAGLGRKRMRLVPVREDLSMDVDALAAMTREDAAAGRAPVFVGATLGTTGAGAFDALEGIADVARAHGAWVHVDAAWAGAAFVCPEHRGVLRGVERADSFSFNPHKWLLTNFDCSAFWLNGGGAKAALRDAMSITPEYLRNAASESGAVVDFRDWHIPLGRRFRSLKLWFVMRHYGVRGLQAYVRGHIREAEALERVVHASDDFEVAAPRSLSLLCVAHVGGDDATRRVHERVNERGRVYLTHTTVPRADGERYVIRAAIGGTLTGPEHVRLLWRELREASDFLRSGR